MKIIELTKGKVAIVDDDDYNELSKYKWQYTTFTGHEYARRAVNYTSQNMHRFIMNPPNGMEVDHINGNGLDNRRCNLRICTPTQNQWNSKTPITNTSGYKCVIWEPKLNKWRVRIRKDGKRYTIGYYKNIEDAHKAQVEYSIKLHGEFSSALRPEE
jgi:hypothetical protein